MGPASHGSLYLAFGATHAPHQAPTEYLQRWKGRFDNGYDVARQRWFARQLQLGIIPAGTTLAPPNPGVPAWADLSPNQRAFAARLPEACLPVGSACTVQEPALRKLAAVA
jgi:arylsulfatase A-like enzyme